MKRNSQPAVDAALMQTLKQALTETLHEQRGLLQEVFAEVLEDFALTEAVREGKRLKPAQREQVFKVLRGRA